jgi:fumarate reductase subunit C
MSVPRTSGGEPVAVPTYKAPISTWWWLSKRTYFVFVMRELSSIFVAWSAVFLILLVAAVGEGESAYEDFLDWAATPWVVVVNVVALAFLVLHTITWFALTPQAMDVRLGGRRVPGWIIIASQYVGLAVVSAFVFWLVTR